MIHTAHLSRWILALALAVSLHQAYAYGNYVPGSESYLYTAHENFPDPPTQTIVDSVPPTYKNYRGGTFPSANDAVYSLLSIVPPSFTLTYIWTKPTYFQLVMTFNNPKLVGSGVPGFYSIRYDAYRDGVPNDAGVGDQTIYDIVRSNLTITLSGGSSVEPWNKKRDPDHVNTNLPFKAIVTDQSGQAKANIGVTITSDVTANSGGHNHNANRPKGKLVATPAGTPTPVGTRDGIATITGVTDGSGVFSFAFGAEEASGEHQLTATCPDCKAQATAPMNVAIQGLTLLSADPVSYNLLGATQPHPDNHYFSSDAKNKIINLAREFRKGFGEVLKINDSSLVRGGVLDLGQDWTYANNGHAGHRKGVVVDINNYRANSDPDFEVFAKRCCGIQAQWHKKGTAPHYHLLLLERDE